MNSLHTDQELRNTPFNNTYFALRHGQSEANVSGVIISSLDGLHSYGLSLEGQRQVTESINSLPEGFSENLLIYSSDFLRTKQTAMIAYETLQPAIPITYAEALRERFFGEYDGEEDSHYKTVWSRDKVDDEQHVDGVESVVSVLERTLSLIGKLEKQYQAKKILLVAHGDVLQILQTTFEGIPAGLHRTLPSLNVAEVRQLNKKI